MIRVIENQILNIVPDGSSRHNMVFFSGHKNVHWSEDYEKLLIRRCIIDMRAIPLVSQNEAVNLICGAKADVYDTLFIGAKKACLCGNGEWPTQDVADGEVLFDGCVWIDCCRTPEAQDGVKVVMRNCWAHNWSDSSVSDLRGVGAWARTGASIMAENCMFTQSGFSRQPLKTKFADCIAHFGQAWSNRPSKWRDYLLPGICRGLTAARGAHVEAAHCWTNHWWISLENRKGTLRTSDRRFLVHHLHTHLHPEYEHVLGYSLMELFESLHGWFEL